MFSLSMSVQPQVTVPLSHLINVLQSLKGSVNTRTLSTSKSTNNKEHATDAEQLHSEPLWSLRDLGLSDLGKQQLDELVNGVFPHLSTQDLSLSLGHIGKRAWRTSHLSTHSFYHNKHGFPNVPGTMSFFAKHSSPFQSELQIWPVWVQSRGFKTLRNKTRRLQTDSLRRTRLILLVLLLVELWHLKDTFFIGTVPNYIRPGLCCGPVQMKNVTFEHVKGVEEAKNELQEVVEFLKNPQKFTALGGKLPKGVLLVGPPGTGRLSWPEQWLERQNALIRPGRFDMQVTVPKPDIKGRTEILNWYLKKIKVDPAIEATVIARGTVGFSGADLENLVNQAALKAAVDEKDMVTMKELEFAKDKILMGPERRSAEIDKKNKEITAYHESGHAIVAYYTKDAMPINKATIMPRGPSLGHVSMLPENDRWSETRSQLLAQMDVSMGGRVAEEMQFGPETSQQVRKRASSDFDAATRIARMMVTRYGMCDKLGVMTYSDMTEQSPETQAAVENEVRLLLKESYERAKTLLKSHTKEHKSLADALLMYETLDAKEIKMVLEGKALDSR
ncbi:hypothetical protein WMY93_000782 [Mugilogobius chulae]|uniref:ATP-dependent zinc metalloprotease YME1L1 n=1 Tax=Mugilogobius chulae TaxID=88201 RepID=A0AAW0Q086_9GOBI